MLHAAVVGALEKVNPLDHHAFEFRKTLRWRQSGESMDGVVCAAIDAPDLPVTVQGASPARFQFAFCSKQNDKTPEARE